MWPLDEFKDTVICSDSGLRAEWVRPCLAGWRRGVRGSSTSIAASLPRRSLVSSAYRPTCWISSTASTTPLLVVVKAGPNRRSSCGCPGYRREPTPAEDMPVDVWQRTIDVNFVGVLPDLPADRPSHARPGPRPDRHHRLDVRVHTSSTTRSSRWPVNSSKAGIVAATKSLAFEWAARGVRVNALSPGHVDTPLLASKVPSTRSGKGHTVGPVR